MASTPRQPRSGRGKPPAQPPSPSFETALALVRRWVEQGLVPGAAVVVARDGRVLGELNHGSANSEHPVEAETLFSLASITTLYTACAAMALVEDGLLALDEPLGTLLPELPTDDRSVLSLRRLLTHTSGLPPDLGPEETARIGATPSLEEIVGQYAQLRPTAPPGSQVRYSNVGFGLLGQVVERASGQPFTAFLRRRVCEPLELDNTFLPAEPDCWARLARVAGTDDAGAEHETFNSAWWRGLGLPYGGAVATARDVARFLSACAAEFAAPGFLSPSTLEYMTHNQTAELAGGIPNLIWSTRAEWGLGFELRGDKHLHPFGELTSAETFGHLGLSGTMAWVDPSSGLVCVLLTNRLLTPEPALRLTALCRFSNAVAAALREP